MSVDWKMPIRTRGGKKAFYVGRHRFMNGETVVVVVGEGLDETIRPYFDNGGYLNTGENDLDVVNVFAESNSPESNVIALSRKG